MICFRAISMRNFFQRRSQVVWKKLPRSVGGGAMNETVRTAEEGTRLVSYGSGNGSRAAGRRSQGRGGRQVAPAGATRSLLSAARRNASTPGRGRRTRQALLEEIQAAAQRARGGSRLTNRQIQQFRARLG